MPRGTSRIFREKVSSAASALGISGGVDFRRASDVFIEKARDAYADLGFGVGAAGRSSREFRQAVELANAELGIAAFTAQTFSIDFDGVTEQMASLLQTAPPRIGFGPTFTIACWFKPRAAPLTSRGTIFDFTPVPSNAGNQIALFSRDAGPTGPNGIQLIIVDNGNSIRQNVSWQNRFPSLKWYHLAIQWSGTVASRKLFIDGVDAGAPDFISGSTPGILDDLSDRSVGIGRSAQGVGLQDGLVASLAAWPILLGGAELLTLFNGNSIAIDLKTNSGSYTSATSLVHWNEIGKLVSPNLGADSVTTGNPIDLELAAVGITDADRVADVP